MKKLGVVLIVSLAALIAGCSDGIQGGGIAAAEMEKQRIEGRKAREQKKSEIEEQKDNQKAEARGQSFHSPKTIIGPDDFLNQYNLEVQGPPSKFQVIVPESWEVPLGSYPVGLYWGLANQFSKDAGLDLTSVKGKTVEVLRYSLADGLPGEGSQSGFKYPSMVILLVQDQKVVGAWLAFNVAGIGPSVKKRSLREITGLTFEEWVEREKYFSDPGKNGDLASLGPKELLDAFFSAINNGDKVRANACLSPRAMQNSLTTNLIKDCLYNPGFGNNNSLVENIIKAYPVSYKILDPEKPAVEISETGHRSKIQILVVLDIRWRDSAFNSPTGNQTRFVILEKYANGWKLDGLGSG